MYIDQAIQTIIKEDKYNPLIEAISAQGWTIKPLIVILVGAKGTLHASSIHLLEVPHIHPTNNKGLMNIK